LCQHKSDSLGPINLKAQNIARAKGFVGLPGAYCVTFSAGCGNQICDLSFPLLMFLFCSNAEALIHPLSFSPLARLTGLIV